MKTEVQSPLTLLYNAQVGADLPVAGAAHHDGDSPQGCQVGSLIGPQGMSSRVSYRSPRVDKSVLICFLEILNNIISEMPVCFLQAVPEGLL